VRDKLAGLLALVSLGRSIEIKRLTFENVNVDISKGKIWFSIDRAKTDAALSESSFCLLANAHPLRDPITIWTTYLKLV